MTSVDQKLSVREKIGYSLGDLSANLIFQTLMTFLAFYYTDVSKISPSAASTIIFIGGMAGAFFNPIMGAIADRTRTRWGKFRPWILWTSIPFGVFAILAFTTPNLDDSAKIVYAQITYILLVMIYAANNLPYSALSGVLTGDMAERNSLSSYRFLAVMVAQFVVQVLLLPLVLILGHGDQAEGFKLTMTIFAIVGTVFFIITFLTTKERIVPAPEQRSTLKQDIADLCKNRPWIIMLVLTMLVFITLALKGGSYIFYFKNYLDTAALAAFLTDVGFTSFMNGLNASLTGMGLTKFEWPEDPATSVFSLFNASGIVFSIIGITLSKQLADKFGKRDLYGVGLFLSTLFLIAIYFCGPQSIGLVFLTTILHGFFYGLTIPVLWAMIADVADYSEWKNNRRATAIIFSAMLFGLKAGLSIGGSLVAGILGFYGYNADLPMQSAETVSGMRLAVSFYPAIPFLLACGCLFFYEINKAMETRMETELKARRAGKAQA